MARAAACLGIDMSLEPEEEEVMSAQDRMPNEVGTLEASLDHDYSAFEALRCNKDRSENLAGGALRE